MSMDDSPPIVDQLSGTRTLSLVAEGESVTMTLMDGDQTIAKIGRADRHELRSVFVAGATIVPFVEGAVVGFRMQSDSATVRFSKDAGVLAAFDASEVRAAIFPEDSY
ncbi:MAG: hypothetical protein IH944_08250 [Armatimonadetes bacterium]|nr:hypothetical protein [Armatimonadota bacterium]